MNSNEEQQHLLNPIEEPEEQPKSVVYGAMKSSKSSSRSTSDRADVWQNPLDFLMSMVAYAVSLGNVWRFPYLAFRWGGGTFLFVYAIFFFCLAVPMFLMEAAVGQYLGRGAMEIWKVFPILKGVGFGNLMICFCTIIYFPIIVSWAVFYFINSFRSPFPWSTCGNYWNNNDTCVPIRGLNKNFSNVSTLSTNEYYSHRVLHESNGFFEFEGVQWELLTIMVVVWLIVYFCIWRGLINARLFIWFSALSPYISIFALVICGFTLDGWEIGVKAYLTPKFYELKNPNLWLEAGSQVFYSYGIGFGTITSLGAYNAFNHNVIRDSIALCFINGATSIIAGFAIFTVLGHLSYETGMDLEQLATSGTGLAFEIYPVGLAEIFWPRFWSVIFFFMVFFLGLNSQVCMTEALYTSFEDRYPRLLRVHKKKCIVVLIAFIFLLSLVMVTHAGTYWLQLFNSYAAAGYSLMLIALFEVVGITWGFGAEKVIRGIEEMRGVRLPWIFVLLWKYVGPLMILSTLILNLWYYQSMEKSLKLKIKVPISMEIFAILLSLSSVVFVPGYAIYYMFSKPENSTFIERWRQGTTTPANVNHKRVKQFSLVPALAIVDSSAAQDNTNVQGPIKQIDLTQQPSTGQ